MSELLESNRLSLVLVAVLFFMGARFLMTGDYIWAALNLVFGAASFGDVWKAVR